MPVPTPPTEPADLGPEHAPGRHGRARTLARRRSDGEQLTDYEGRLLAAHVAACERCREWTEALPSPVAAGQATPSRDTVVFVDASGASGSGEARQENSEDADSARRSGVTPVAKGEEVDESELDAMGRPKRRAVVGQGYGPTKARQVLSYAAAVAVIIGLYFGAIFAVSKLDTAPANDKPQAPWAQKGAPQTPPQRFQ